jgi:hypothetical protein
MVAAQSRWLNTPLGRVRNSARRSQSFREADLRYRRAEAGGRPLRCRNARCCSMSAPGHPRRSNRLLTTSGLPSIPDLPLHRMK